MSDAMRTFFIFAGLAGLWIWIFLQGIENKKKEAKLKKKEEVLRKKNKSKKKKEDKPWIELPNLAMMLVYGIGIAYLISLFYGLSILANIIGPFGLVFLFLWLISMNKKKQ